MFIVTGPCVWVYLCVLSVRLYIYVFYKGTGSTRIYALSLHDALPILAERSKEIGTRLAFGARGSDILTQFLIEAVFLRDRKSTPMNSSHG